MTDPNQPNSDPGWVAPPQPSYLSQPGNSQQSSEAGQYQPPAQPGQWDHPGQYSAPSPYGASGQLGAGGMPATPPPSQRRTGKILAIVGGALVLAIVAVVVTVSLTNKHSDNLAKAHMFSVPARAGALVRQTDATASSTGNSLLAAIKSQDPDGVFSNPMVGVYSHAVDGAPGVILLGLNVADSKELAHEMDTRSIDDVAGEILKSAGLNDATSYDAGTLGGTLQCGTLDEPHGKLATCVWLDHSTLGVVFQISGSPDQAAAIAKDIRTAGEK